MKTIDLTLASLELALAKLGFGKKELLVSPELERIGIALARTLSVPAASVLIPCLGLGLKVMTDWQGKQWNVQGEQ